MYSLELKRRVHSESNNLNIEIAGLPEFETCFKQLTKYFLQATLE